MAEPGEMLAGKYRIERVLGAGGMGVVVAAEHIDLHERVAIKFLLPDAVQNPEAVTRFTREARAAIKIKSPHVARITDVGKLDNGAPYMVMEYLEGQDLSAMVRQRGALPIAEAVELVTQACDAIAEAHALGIVHRDLKPANLFCAQGADGLPSIKVLDFGISKVTTLDGLDMTRTAAMIGSPLYMSPEQMTSARSVDARADIWALGVVLYELIAGRPPFQGQTLPELSVRIATETPPPIRNFRPDLPDGLEPVILRCLEKDREQRYANVAELVGALVEFGPKRVRVSAERISRIIQNAGLSKSAVQLPPSSEFPVAQPDEGAGPAQGTVAAWGGTGIPGERRSRRGVVLAVVVVALGAIGCVFALHSGKVAVAATASATPAAAPAASDSAVTPAASEPTVVPAPSGSASAPVASAAPSPASAHAETPPAPLRKAARAPARRAAHEKPERAASKRATAKPRAPKPVHAAKPNCNPPYTIGPNGNHVYKPQCL